MSPHCVETARGPRNEALKKGQKQERSSGTLGGCYPAFIHVLGFLPFLVTNDDLDDWRTPLPGQEDLPLGWQLHDSTTTMIDITNTCLNVMKTSFLSTKNA